MAIVATFVSGIATTTTTNSDSSSRRIKLHQKTFTVFAHSI